MVKLVTDHGDLAYFYSKLEPNYNPLCRFCREQNETFLHLTKCPRLRTYQNECFAGNTVSHTWKISKLLEFSYKKELNALIDGYDCNVSNLSIFSEASSEDSFTYILAVRARLKRLGRERGDEKKEEAKREESEF